MLTDRDKKRAQTSVEYMLALALTIVLVASIMVTGFKELELDLTLSAARMGGTDFTAKNSNYTLGRIDFRVNEMTNTVNVTPRFHFRGIGTASAADATDANTLCFMKMQSVFHPELSNATADYCFDAPYRRYCITAMLLPA